MTPSRVVLRTYVTLVVAVILGGCSPSPTQPNVVVVVVDTLRADRLPFMGGEEVAAPFLSELAARSVVFESCWSTSSWTAPATASIFTGVYPNQHGVETGLRAASKASRWKSELRLNQLPPQMLTLPEWMRGLGFRTFGVSDNPNISDKLGFERGFDRFTSFGYAGAAQINEVLAEWSDEIRDSAPWFVYLHYMDPHFPYHLWDEFYSAPGSVGAYADSRARYDSEIGYVDQHLREAFDALHVDEDTVVIFVSDHGEEFGEHGGTQHGHRLYSELTWVPMFVHHPGVEPRRMRVQANVSVVDLLPTLRDILGSPASEHDEGMSLARYYLDGELPPSRSIFAMRTLLEHQGARSSVVGSEPGVRKSVKRAVVHDNYKYVFTEPSHERKLFDLVADPKEKRNLVHEQPEIAEEMHQRWVEFHASARTWRAAEVGVSVTAEETRNFRALGYTGK